MNRIDPRLRRHFLRRLAHLLRQRQVHGDELNDAGRRLLEFCLASTVEDCIALGAAGQVESTFRLMRREQR